MKPEKQNNYNIFVCSYATLPNMPLYIFNKSIEVNVPYTLLDEVL